MSDLDDRLFHAKQNCTAMVCDAVSGKRTVQDVAGAIDELNVAWDDLTNQLVAQRSARDATIAWLHGEIATLQRRLSKR